MSILYLYESCNFILLKLILSYSSTKKCGGNYLLYSSLTSMSKCHTQIYYFEKKIRNIIYSQRKNINYFITLTVSVRVPSGIKYILNRIIWERVIYKGTIYKGVGVGEPQG